MFSNNLKLLFLQISFIAVLFIKVNCQTYMITRTRSGEIIKTDLSKPTPLSTRSTSANFKIIERQQWNTITFEKLPEPVTLPIHHVMITKVDVELCTTKEICTWQILHLQSWNVEEIIPYNFLIGGEGSIFEGRGWDLIGKHSTNGYKIEDTISIAYIGVKKRNKDPTDQQIDAAKWLIGEGVRLGKIIKDYDMHPIAGTHIGLVLPQASTVLCENMNNDNHRCTGLHGNDKNL